MNREIRLSASVIVCFMLLMALPAVSAARPSENPGNSNPPGYPYTPPDIDVDLESLNRGPDFVSIPSIGKVLWVPDDYPTIQAAIGAAKSGYTVLVAPGEYLGTVLLKRGVTLMSEAGPEVTTINGCGAWSVVLGADQSAIIGFTITNGWWGVNCWARSPLVQNNIIKNTYAMGVNFWASRPTISNNLITNTLQGMGGWWSAPRIINNTIAEVEYGMWLGECSGRVLNNIIASNIYGIAGGEHLRITKPPRSKRSISDAVKIDRNILWGNLADYWDIEPDSRNISADPGFVGDGDFRLAAGSPCIDAGRSVGSLREDLDGNPRAVDGDGVGNPGIDLGAFEFQGA